MKQKKARLCAALLLVMGLTGLHAQQAIPVAGGNASGSGGSVSYSVGQVVYTTNTGTNGSVAQGVQQPFEISVITGLEQANWINVICSVYPNPTADFLTLKVENYDKENLSYQLYDINGKLLENKKLNGTETGIVMSNLVPATYFLKVTQNTKEVKIFKIIKS
jgi:Secretion system C-terminal sorting domain